VAQVEFAGHVGRGNGDDEGWPGRVESRARGIVRGAEIAARFPPAIERLFHGGKIKGLGEPLRWQVVLRSDLGEGIKMPLRPRGRRGADPSWYHLGSHPGNYPGGALCGCNGPSRAALLRRPFLQRAGARPSAGRAGSALTLRPALSGSRNPSTPRALRSCQLGYGAMLAPWQGGVNLGVRPGGGPSRGPRCRLDNLAQEMDIATGLAFLDEINTNMLLSTRHGTRTAPRPSRGVMSGGLEVQSRATGGHRRDPGDHGA